MKKAGCVFLVLCFFTCVFAQQKPNIIYIYADDLGYGELGCYGQQKIKTPNLDQIAREGIRFTQHYTSAPVCAPARCMLMTGKHSGHSYIRGNYELGEFGDNQEGGQMPLPEGTFTIAQLMKQAGYTTGAIGKWGLGMNATPGDPNKQGFDYFYGYLDQKQAHNYYPTHLWENGKWDSLHNPFIKVHRPLSKDASDTAFLNFKGKDYSLTKMAEKTLAFIRQNKNKPFFLYLPYTAPHVSLQAPDEAVNEYRGKFDEKPYRGEKGGLVGTTAVGTTGTSNVLQLVNLGVRAGVDRVRFVKVNLDPVLRQNARQSAVTYPEVVNSNGVVIRQVVSRFIARPEILISARDLGVIDNYAPVAFEFSPVTFQNTGATLDAAAEGPGNIEPVSSYTFSKLGVYSLHVGNTDEQDGQPGNIWGSFDGSTNAPILYPIGSKLSDLEAAVLSLRSN